jgi:hypothetical protein
MRPLPKSYMLRSPQQRLAMHEEIAQTLDDVSSTSLQNIYRQLQDVNAKRTLIREILISMDKGMTLDAILAQIDTTIQNDALFEE